MVELDLGVSEQAVDFLGFGQRGDRLGRGAFGLVVRRRRIRSGDHDFIEHDPNEGFFGGLVTSTALTLLILPLLYRRFGDAPPLRSADLLLEDAT